MLSLMSLLCQCTCISCFFLISFLFPVLFCPPPFFELDNDNIQEINPNKLCTDYHYCRHRRYHHHPHSCCRYRATVFLLRSLVHLCWLHYVVLLLNRIENFIYRNQGVFIHFTLYFDGFFCIFLFHKNFVLCCLSFTLLGFALLCFALNLIWLWFGNKDGYF